MNKIITTIKNLFAERPVLILAVFAFGIAVGVILSV